MRDTGRSDAYAAEDAAFDGTAVQRTPGGPALEGALTVVLGSAWWRANIGDPAVVRRVQVRTAADSHWAPRTGTLAIDPHESWYVLTHELAHVVAASGAGSTAHGPNWRGWNVALVTAVFGPPFADLLRDSFRRHALAVDEPGIAPPPAPLVTIAARVVPRGGWLRPR